MTENTVCNITLYPTDMAEHLDIKPNKSVGIPKAKATVRDLLEAIAHSRPQLLKAIEALDKNVTRTPTIHVRRENEILPVDAVLSEREVLAVHVIPAIAAAKRSPITRPLTSKEQHTRDYTRSARSVSRPTQSGLLRTGLLVSFFNRFKLPEGPQLTRQRRERHGKMLFRFLDADELASFDSFAEKPPAQGWPKPLPPTAVLLGRDGPARRAAFEQLAVKGTRSFWVIPGSVLAGPAPTAEHALRPILECGARTFIDLRMTVEGDEYTELARDLLAEMIADGSMAARDHGERIRLREHAIPDLALLASSVQLGRDPSFGAPEETPPSAPDLAVDRDVSVARLVFELFERAAGGEILYIHCSKGHGRTGTVCSLLLGLAYNLSGPHAVLLYQALHDVSSKAFRRELATAEIALRLVNDAGSVHDKVVTSEEARSFDFLQKLAQQAFQVVPASFIADVSDKVAVTDDAGLELLIDGLLNSEEPETTPTRLTLRTSGVSVPTLLSAQGREADGVAPPQTASLQAMLQKMKGSMSVDESMHLLTLMNPSCSRCNALYRDQTRQVLRLLQPETKQLQKAAEKVQAHTRATRGVSSARPTDVVSSPS